MQGADCPQASQEAPGQSQEPPELLLRLAFVVLTWLLKGSQPPYRPGNPRLPAGAPCTLLRCSDASLPGSSQAPCLSVSAVCPPHTGLLAGLLPPFLPAPIRVRFRCWLWRLPSPSHRFPLHLTLCPPSALTPHLSRLERPPPPAPLPRSSLHPSAARLLAAGFQAIRWQGTAASGWGPRSRGAGSVSLRLPLMAVLLPVSVLAWCCWSSLT